MRLVPAVAVLAVLAANFAAAAEPNPHNTLDCLFCHKETPRWGIDTRESVEEIGFYLYEGDDPKLCFKCHRPEENLHPVEVTPGSTDMETLKPVLLPLGTSWEMEGKVVCTTCHFVHAADADAVLLRGFPGSQNPESFEKRQELCLQCHGERLKERSPHSGDERSCLFCHTTSPVKGKAAKVGDMGVALCNFCHGVTQEGHEQGVNPFDGPVDCLTCHSPHLGPKHPGRLRPEYYDFLRGAVTVKPHGRETLCGLCHIDREDYSLAGEEASTLCRRCHGTPKVVGESHPLREVPEGMTLPEGWPTLNGRLSCLTCHVVGHPEDGSPPKLLRGGPYESLRSHCALCHDPQETVEANPHAMVRELKGCRTCHDALPVFGRDTARTVTFVASVTLVCLRCHEDRPHPAKVTHLGVVGTERAADIPDFLPLDRYDRVTCATCHNPHLPDSKNHKLRDSTEDSAICGSCHVQ
jgi:hypothetical protein